MVLGTTSRHRRQRPAHRSERGQETLQAILIFAFVLLPVIVAIFTFGSLIHLYIGAQAAAASGARSAGSAGGFGPDQSAAIDDELRSNDIDPSGCSITVSSSSVGLGEPIAVTVSCPQHVGIPFLLDRDVTVSSTFVSRGEVNH